VVPDDCSQVSWHPLPGVPPNQIGPEFYTVEFYETILKEIFLDPEFGQTNTFSRFYYEKGYKDQSCCPRTLQEKYFALLRKNATCYEWHHATVQETMERVRPCSFTKLVLLDHMDWMPIALVHEELIALQRATVPGALVLWRSAFLIHMTNHSLIIWTLLISVPNGIPWIE
jgi:betaine lipid synthase